MQVSSQQFPLLFLSISFDFFRLLLYFLSISLLPMSLLTIRNLHKSYADSPLFDGLDLTIERGQKIGLVAKNGAWKSTLLECIVGNSDYPVGEIAVASGTTIRYARQTLAIPDATLVKDALIEHDDHLGQLILKYEQTLHNTESTPEQIQSLLDEIEEKDGRSFETKLNTIISKLQLTPLLNQTVGSLSWWERKRLGLAMALIYEPDLLLLDEPTNHLDLEMIERLEKELKKSWLTFVLISHDRYIIERTCTHIYELEQGKIIAYTGGYDAYLDQKAARLDAMTKQAHVLKQEVKRELARVRKAPRARGTKSVKRIAAFDTLEKTHENVKQIVATATKKLDLSSTTRKLWGKIIQIHSLQKAYDHKIIVDNFSYNFRAGERVGIIGKNGVGKSTFIKMLLWEIPVDNGKILIGEKVVIGHYQQADISYHLDKTVLDIVKEQADSITIWGKTISATKLLERFLFSPRAQYAKAYTLSGGEKRRLHLLTVLIQNPNFLILDEPTNDLDLMTLHVLEEFLLSFQWCLVIISHDRFFMDRLVDHLFVFEWAGKITDFRGTYSMRKESQKNGSTETKKPPVSPDPLEPLPTFAPKKSLTYNEKREFEALEIEIAALQSQQEAINLAFQAEQLSHEQIKTLSLELGKVCNQLEKAEARWCELAERW